VHPEVNSTAVQSSTVVERNIPIEQTVSQETVMGCPEYRDSIKAGQRKGEEQGKPGAQEALPLTGTTSYSR
jgi:hypothetical protein